MNASGVGRAGPEQVNQQDMDPQTQGLVDLRREGLDVLRPVLVARRDDLHQSDDPVAADVAYRQGATGQPVGLTRLDDESMLDAWGGLRQGQTAPGPLSVGRPVRFGYVQG